MALDTVLINRYTKAVRDLATAEENWKNATKVRAQRERELEEASAEIKSQGRNKFYSIPGSPGEILHVDNVGTVSIVKLS